MREENISSIIQELEEIVESCIKQANPHGLFAALYLKVTRAIRAGIEQRRFEDNIRMERFDVIFARRYLDAYEAQVSGKPCTTAWKVVFDAKGNRDMLAIHHLLLGMNAHINLDLGLVAAQVSQGASLDDLEADFIRINEILINMLEEVQSGIDSISPAMWLVDWLFAKKDEAFAGFSMRSARTYAWRSAQLLHGTPPTLLPEQIALIDQAASVFGLELSRPRRLLRGVLAIVRRFEHRDVAFQIRRIGA